MEGKVYKAKGKNLKTALKAAERFFGTSAENLDINIIKMPLRIFGVNLTPAVIEASLKPQCEENDIDGSFYFDYRPDGVYLVLCHPSGRGKQIDEDDVVQTIHVKEIRDINFSNIAKALVSKKDEILIAPFQEKKIIDEAIEITFGPDDMEVYIKLTPPDGGKTHSYDEIVSAIAESGVVFGIDYEIIKELAENRVYGKQIKFAEGNKGKDGKDAGIEYVLDLSTSSQKPKFLSDGSVNYYEIDNYKTVKAGDVIARYIPPVPGTPGSNVKGETIKAYDGKDIKLPLGEQVVLAENGVDIIANVDGIAEIKGGKICVSNFLVINGDVDLSTGNIKFYGNVKVLGNVLSCLSVTADGSIEIDGYVEAAKITAQGNIKIKRGVTGGKNSMIKAGGSVYADFLENTKVQAGKSVFANSIIYSEVESGESIVVSGFKGIIYGGRHKALKKITAKVIGSNANVATLLELGITPSMRNEYERLKSEISKNEKELSYLSEIVSKAPVNLNKRQEEIKTKIIAQKIRKKFELEKLKSELLKIEKEIENDSDASVNVMETIYPGTKIVIKTKVLTINSPSTYTKYKLVDGEIVPLPYNEK